MSVNDFIPQNPLDCTPPNLGFIVWEWDDRYESNTNLKVGPFEVAFQADAPGYPYIKPYTWQTDGGLEGNDKVVKVTFQK